MGNHDERIAFDIEVTSLERRGPEERDARICAIEWSRNGVTAASKVYLASLPRHLQLSFGERQSLRLQFVHASIRSLDEYIYQDHPEEDVEAMFQLSGANVVVMGHTHLPYVRTFAHTNRFWEGRV